MLLLHCGPTSNVSKVLMMMALELLLYLNHIVRFLWLTSNPYVLLSFIGIQQRYQWPFVNYVVSHSKVTQEGGLLGSQAVATSYAAREVGVYAMSQVCALVMMVVHVIDMIIV